MDMFDSIRQGMNDQAMASSQQDANLAQKKLRLATGVRDMLEEEAIAKHAMYMEMVEKNKVLQEYIGRLEEINVHDRKTINTLRESLGIAASFLDGQHKALLQATGDVAQLLDIDPSAVAGRYKLAVIDTVRSDIDAGFFATLDEEKYPTHWNPGASFEDKIQSRMLQSTEFKRLLATGKLSSKEAEKKVKDKFGMELSLVNNMYYWIDWNPSLLADVVPANDIAAYQDLDSLIVKAVNIKSDLIPSGIPLIVELGSRTQRADSAYGLKQETGKVKPVGLHPFLQESKPQWNWTAEGRLTGWNVEKYRATAQGLGVYLSNQFGVDMTGDNIVKPKFSKDKNKDVVRTQRQNLVQQVSM
ncbi:hypothetical protein R6242_19350 [Iodobacter sp. CM08]|uniref:hypothetical protein n=1 Tax=Iodobacter sp. CM08 TaxID=3085902 RepID=UPI00298162FB|nr:hypothetical protein [Iodobacter sp. CM08]MDW5418728.1 hypothetical protein [Iodobacter sp. CM08]